MTLQEFIDKAVIQAKVGLDPQSVSTRNELVANSLLNQVFYDAAVNFSNSGKPIRFAKTLTFTNGTATLTDDVLTGSITDADLYDPDDPTKVYAFVPAWEDFIRVYDTRIGYFTIREGSIAYVIEPGSRYVQGSGLSDTLTLVVAGIPAVPATASATIDAPPEFVLAALDLTVERLKGAVPA